METLRPKQPFLKKFGEHVQSALFSFNQPCWHVDQKDRSSLNYAGWLHMFTCGAFFLDECHFQLYKTTSEVSADGCKLPSACLTYVVRTCFVVFTVHDLHFVSLKRFGSNFLLCILCVDETKHEQTVCFFFQ